MLLAAGSFVTASYWRVGVMAVYSYRAFDATHQLVRGTISGDTAWEARQRLRERGLLVQEISAHRSRGVGWLRRLGRKRHRVAWAEATRELATLLAVDVPLLEALDTLVLQHSGRFQAILLELRDRVAAGSSLAEAMRVQSDVFDSLSVCMVEVGERGGHLDDVLDRLADFKEKSLELKDRVLSALLYPGIVLSISMLVSLFLMTFVVPLLLENLSKTGRPLPWPTRVLKGASDLLAHHGVTMLILAGILFALLLVFLRSLSGQRWKCRVLLRLPIIGSLVRKQEIARISFVISTLMRSGVVFLEALHLASQTTNNILMRESLAECDRLVGAGRDIGAALASSGFFPQLVVHVFTVGQRSGRLEEMLERLAVGYERQVSSSAGRLAAALEPVLILFLSIFVGFILFATMLPILEAGNAI